MPNNYLRYSIISLLFVTPFVALIVTTGLFFPYITGKNLIFRTLIELAFVLYAILALRAPEFRPRLTSVLVAFASFIGVILIADVFGIYPFKSFWSNFERMEGFVTHLHLFGYFIMLGAVFTGEKLWTRFFQTSLAASVVVGLMGLDPAKMTSGRIFSQLGNPSYLGAYLLFHIFIAGFLLIRVIERKGDSTMKWLAGLTYGAVILFDFYIFYNTGTRGALLGLLAGALFTSVAFAIWEKNRGLKVLGISVLAAIVIAVGLLASFKQSPFIANNNVLSRFAALATFDRAEIAKFTTTEGRSRFGIWHIAMEGFKEKPILGWGQDNFNYVFNKYYDPKIYDQEQWFDRAHNVFFDWLIAGGILGLLAYLALFALGIVAIWRSRAHEKDLFFLFSDKLLLTALFIAYFIHNLFVFDSITSYILFFGVLAFIHIHDRKALAWPALIRPIKDMRVLQAGAIAIVFVGIVAMYEFVLAPYHAGISLIESLQYQNYALARADDAAFQKALDSYDEALSYDSVTGISETREQLLQGAQQALSSPDASSEVRSEYFNKTDAEFKKQLATSPDDTRYYLFYGLFLTRVASASTTSPMMEEGMRYLQRAAELSPRKQSVLHQIGTAYLNNGEYKTALPYFQKAFELDPAFDEARFLYALAALYAGQPATTTAILAPFKGTAYPVDFRLIRAYYMLGQTAKVQELLKAKVAYADKLAADGRKQEALQEYSEVIEISPSYKAEGERKMAEIQASL